MGRGKGVFFLLVAVAAIAIVVWFLQQEDAAHTGRRSAAASHDTSPTATPTTETPPSSPSKRETATDGEPNLTAPDAPPEFRDIAILCTIDGVPGLPSKFEYIGPRLIDRRDDKEAGTVRGRMLHEAGEVEVTILAREYVADGARASAPEGQPILVRLRSRVDLELQVDGRPDFAAHVDLQRFEEPHGWRVAEGATTIGDGKDTDQRSVRPFEVGAGRYRAVLPGGVVLHEFEVWRGASSMVIPIDLRRAEWLTLEVTGPDGIKFDARGLVTVSGSGVAWPHRTLHSRRFIHPGDRALRFEVSAPTLAPHPTRGSAVRREGGTLNLKAITGATVTFDWPGDPVHGHSVLRLRPGGRPRLMAARLHYETYRFFDSPGKHDYIFHVRGSAPLLLRGVEVKAPLHEMGMLPAVAGQTVRVMPAQLGEFDVFACAAHWIDHDVPLWRRVAHRNAPVATFEGIPAGKIRFTFAARGKTWTHDHVSNGKGVVRLPIELPSR